MGPWILLAVAVSLAGGCARAWVRSKLYPDDKVPPTGWSVATATTEEMALDRALSEGQTYCRIQGKKFKRLAKEAYFTGKDLSGDATQTVVSPVVGKPWK